MSQKKCFKTSIGGQALIEGIMMLGPEKANIAVRAQDGTIVKKDVEVTHIKEKLPFLGWPGFRGVVNFIESMKIGFGALMYSADFYPEDPNYKPGKFDLWLEKKFPGEKGKNLVMTISLTLAIVFMVGVFILLPSFIGGVLNISGVMRNVVESVTRIALFLLYMFAVSKMNDIKRTFSYHGAEHKTIACYEAGEDLTVENVKKFTRFHPRCGTSFLLVVMIISIIVFSLVTVVFPIENVFLRMATRLLLLPVVVSLSYEFNRLVGRHDNIFTKILRAPGLWLQRLTTNEPDESMIEVAIAALLEVIPKQEGNDKW